MNDYFLRFDSEAAADAVLFDSIPGSPVWKTVPGTKYLVKGTAEDDFEDYTTFDPPEGAEVLDSWPEDQEVADPDAPPQVMKKPRYQAIDVIGTIYKPTGEMLTTDEGEVPEMAPVEGWHVNVRHKEEAPELVPYQVFPQAPVRGWA